MKNTPTNEALTEALVHLRAINSLLCGLMPAAGPKPVAMAMRDGGRWWLAPVSQSTEDILRLRSVLEGDLLYAKPEARQPLSIEDIEKHCGHIDLGDPDWVRQVVRATEAAHGIAPNENQNGERGE